MERSTRKHQNPLGPREAGDATDGFQASGRPFVSLLTSQPDSASGDEYAVNVQRLLILARPSIHHHIVNLEKPFAELAPEPSEPIQESGFADGDSRHILSSSSPSDKSCLGVSGAAYSSVDQRSDPLSWWLTRLLGATVILVASFYLYSCRKFCV